MKYTAFVLFGLLSVVPPARAAYTTRTVTVQADVTGDGRLHVTVRFTGDKAEPAIVHDFYGVSKVDIQKQAETFLAQLNLVQADAVSLTANAVLENAPAPIVTPPPDPTPTQIAVTKFATAYQQYKTLHSALTLKLIEPDDADLAKAKADMLANFIPEAALALDPSLVLALPPVK